MVVTVLEEGWFLVEQDQLWYVETVVVLVGLLAARLTASSADFRSWFWGEELQEQEGAAEGPCFFHSQFHLMVFVCSALPVVP